MQAEMISETDAATVGTAVTDTVANRIWQRAILTPAALAMADGEEIRYAQLLNRASRLAWRLRDFGANRGAPVGLYLRRSSRLVVGALAAWLNGAAYVPLDPEWPTARVLDALADVGSTLLLTEPELRGRFFATTEPRICVEDQCDGPISSSPEFPTGADCAYIVFTSGSTGRPNGIEVSHASLANLAGWHRGAFALAPGDRATLIASPGFDASVWEMWPALAAGASLHVPDETTRRNAERLRDWLLAHGITICFVPTPLAEQLVELAWPKAAALRALLTGGDVLRRAPRPGLPFALFNNYGPSETTVVATCGQVPPRERDELGVRPSLGRPIANVELHILDQACRPVKEGAVGEIYIGGAGVARGYCNRPELTAERFLPDPFSSRPGGRLYRTGDLGRWLANGEVAFHGRADDQIKLRGMRIDPGDITTALEQYPGVQASAVVLEGEGIEGRLVAYLVAAPGARLPAAANLREHLRSRLPDGMVPSLYRTVKALPLTERGKVDRAALRRVEAEPLPDGNSRPPGTPLEQQLAAMVAEALGVEQVGVGDNFFALGGHSLLAGQLVAGIGAQFGVALPLRVIFEHPTVAEMAAEIEVRILALTEQAS